MGVVNIQVTPADFKKVETGQMILADLLAKLFFLPENHQQIVAELQNYHSDEDGAPIVTAFSIADAFYNFSTHTGKVSLTYHVEFTFACADKRATTRHTETSDIIFHPVQSMLNLFIHDKISRDTFEEF